MRRSVLLVSGVLALSACAAAGSALIKAPVENQCAQYGLRGCPELVDGVLLYVDGDEPAAVQKIRRAASKNVPEKLQPFAKAVAGALPGNAGSEIAALLTGEAPLAEAPGGGQPARSDSPSEPHTLARLEHVHLAVAAASDPSRLATGSVAPLGQPDRAACTVGSIDAVCVKLESGPLVVTDGLTPPGCKAELLIGATDSSGQFAWLAPTNTPGFHGARFFVRSNHWLTVTALDVGVDEEIDPRCYVTWAAFRPRIVPPRL